MPYEVRRLLELCICCSYTPFLLGGHSAGDCAIAVTRFSVVTEFGEVHYHEHLDQVSQWRSGVARMAHGLNLEAKSRGHWVGRNQRSFEKTMTVGVLGFQHCCLVVSLIYRSLLSLSLLYPPLQM